MPTDAFLAELGRLSLSEWQASCILRYSQECVPHGPREARDLILDILNPHIHADEGDEPLLSAAELCALPDESRPMVVEGILPSNSLLLISARPKKGKTFLVLQMCEDIASGRPLLGKWEVPQPGNVVLLQMEDGQRRVRARALQRGMGDRNPPVYFYTRRRHVNTPDGVAWLRKKVEPLEPVLIVIDTIRQACGVENWNDAGDVIRRISPLLDLVRELPNGCSILLVHHNNKNPFAEGGDRISGSNALQGIVDGYLIIDKKKRMPNGNLRATVECEGRIDMPDSFVFEMDTETLEIRVLADEELEGERREQEAESAVQKAERVARAIKENGPGSTVEIARWLDVKEDWAKHLVAEAMKQKTIIRVGQANTGLRGRPVTIYGLPSEPERDPFE